jgi:hypothetical protein
MQSAQYCRAQAELCLELARQMSDLKDAAQLRLEAADYFARAVEVERQPSPAPRSGARDRAGRISQRTFWLRGALVVEEE